MRPALLLVAAMALALPTTHAALMAVDFGSEFVKVSLVRPGRAPVSIVLNEMSKRKSPAQVAFVDGDRLIGEEAAQLGVRYPDRVFLRPRELLGRLANDTWTAAWVKERHLPWELEADSDRSTFRVSVPGKEAGKKDTYTAEELVASVLHYARKLAREAADGLDVVETVITVPPYWGQPQRQALVDAATLAGLNVLGLVNNHAAAALQYGIEREFGENTKETVIMYDVGSGSVEAALLEFSSFSLKEAGGKVNTYGQFEVKDVAWAEGVGAETLEIALAEHLAEDFLSKHKSDPRANPKAMAKLRKQVKRLKEMLSANTEAPISVEEMHDGVDFRATVSRQQLEELAGDYWERAVLPLKTLLERNKLKPGDLTAVELIGGGSRVPKLKEALQAAMGGRALDTHLDADEAVVMGAGLFAANLSTAFRLRKFGMTDGVLYPVAFQLTSGGEGDALKPKSLLPIGKKLPVKRVVHLPSNTDEGADYKVAFELRYNTTAVGPAQGDLPPGVYTPLMAQFEVTGLADALSKYNDTESVKVNAHFKADVSGLLTVDRVEAVVDYITQVTTKVPVKVEAAATDKDGAAKEEESAAAADDQGAVPAEDAAGGDTGVDGDTAAEDKAGDDKAGGKEKEKKAEVKYETVTLPKKKTAKVALTIGGSGFVSPAMTKEQVKAGKKVLTELAKRDAVKAETAQAKNNLEAYIINTRDKLEADEEIAKVTTEEQRESFLSQLTEAEDWLYDEGEGEGAPEYKKRLRALQAIGDPITLRVTEMTARPAAFTAAKTWLDLTRKVVNAWETTKPWINATDSEALMAKVADFEKWIEEEEAAQAGKQPHEEPACTSTQVNAKLAEITRAFHRLNNKKKPKPPPAPKAPAAEAGAGGSSSEGGTDGDGTSTVEGGDGKKAGDGAGQQKEGSGGSSSDGSSGQGHDEL